MMDTGYEPDIGRWLDRELKRRGYGAAAEVARQGDVDEGWISRVRHGKQAEMTWESFTKLAAGLRMTRSQLLAAVDGQLPPPDLDRVRAAIESSARLLPEDKATLLGVYERLRVDRG